MGTNGRFMLPTRVPTLLFLTAPLNEKEFDNACCKENLTRFRLLDLMIGVIVADSDGFNEYVANNLPYQQRTGRISRKNLVRIVRKPQD